MTDGEASSRDRVTEILLGYRMAQAVHVAARLKVADLLQKGPISIAQIATAVEADKSSLYRLLRMLATGGFFAEDKPGYFSLTPMGAVLCTDNPESLLTAALYLGGENYAAFADLYYSVISGQPAFRKFYGQDFFTYFERNSERAAIFFGYLSVDAGAFASKVVNAYDFTGIGVVADLGGGDGELLAEILDRHPDTNGLLVELQPMVDRARVVLEDRGLLDRCMLLTGSFLDSLPPIADVYILSAVLHDWDDDHCVRILRNCREAIRGEGALLLIEEVMPRSGGSPSVMMHDIATLVTSGGAVRSLEEYERLLSEAGFEIRRCISVNTADTHILEAAPRRKKC